MPVGTSPEALQRAMRLHQAGRLDEAESLYEHVITASPAHPDGYNFLGILKHQTGRSDEALKLLQKAISLDPDYADAHSNLGNVYKEMDRLKEASAAYNACLALAPNHANALNNLGTVLQAQGRYNEALAVYEQVIQRDAGHSAAWVNYGNVLSKLGRVNDAEKAYAKAIALQPRASKAYFSLGRILLRQQRDDEAITLFRSWLEADPDNATARHLLAATTGEGVPSRASDEYVAETFDEFASTFEVQLKRLKYRGPKLVAKAVGRLHKKNTAKLDILDAGCGTGLVAPLIRGYAKSLQGVDLSTEMVNRARQLNIYDDLVVAELTRFMGEHNECYDLIVSVDTLVYFGELDEVLRAARVALRAGGQLIFTVEKLADSHSPEDYRLNPHGRYSHSQRYLEECLAKTGLKLRSLRDEKLRKESGLPVKGMLIVASKR